MSHESKLNQELTDTELLPSVVLEFKGIKTNSQWDADGKCYFEVIGIGTEVGVNTSVSQSQYEIWKAEKSLSDWKTITF